MQKTLRNYQRSDKRLQDYKFQLGIEGMRIVSRRGARPCDFLIRSCRDDAANHVRT